MSIQPETGASGHPVHPNPPAARADAAVTTAKQKCDHCFTMIVWAKTEPRADATRMPVDAKPAPDGNVVLSVYEPHGLIAGVVQTRGRRRAMVAEGWTFYQHHRLSCPYASRWADKPDAKKPAKTYTRRSRA